MSTPSIILAPDSEWAEKINLEPIKIYPPCLECIYSNPRLDYHCNMPNNVSCPTCGHYERR